MYGMCGKGEKFTCLYAFTSPKVLLTSTTYKDGLISNTYYNAHRIHIGKNKILPIF